jgi:hypothetical protein
MSEVLWLIAAAALSFSGMAWLAPAMEVHWGQVMPLKLSAAAAINHNTSDMGHPRSVAVGRGVRSVR